MRLIERCAALEAQMDRLQAARTNANAHAVIAQRLQEWQTHLERIEQGRRQLDWLGVSSDSDPGLAKSLAETRALTVKARARLVETHDIESVRGVDSLWARLLASAKSCSEALDTVVQRHWCDAVRHHGDFDSSATLRQRAPDTPGNKDGLESYRRAYTTYQKLAGANGPRSAQDLDQLAHLAGELRTAFGKIDFDVPPEVGAFFTALAAGGAGLGLINSRLIDWLRTHGQLDRYVVRDRQG